MGSMLLDQAQARTLARRRWLQAATALAATVVSPTALLAAPDAAPALGKGASTSIKLSLNENPFGPSPLAIQAIKAGLKDLSRYTGREADALVAEIAQREGVDAGQVVLGDVLEALGHHLASEGGRGGEFLYSDPGYTALVEAAQAEGGVGVAVPLDAELNNDLAALERRLSARTRAVFLVNPHNPSGTLSDSAALHDFIGRAARRTSVIVDEAYLEFSADFAGRTATKELEGGARVIVFRTFTKFYGLAALPLGYAVMPEDLASALRKKGLGAPRSQNRLAVLAAAASLKDAKYAEGVRRAVGSERARWLDVLKALGLRHTDAHGNFVFFETGKPHAEIAAAFAAQGVDIGRAFPPLDRWARISIGLPEENARAQSVLRRLFAR
jgi:histidinol-phosphate aminotransferase